MNRTYYYIKVRNLIGKKDDDHYYVFQDGKWKRDTRSIILGYLMGYDETEEDSLYAIGNTEIMEQIQIITEQELNKILQILDQ